MALQNTPENQKLTFPDIQKDFMCATASKSRNAIINDLGMNILPFWLMNLKMYQLKILYYVDKRDHVIEHFLGMLHVNDTSLTTLKVTIDAMFAKHELSISKLRG